MVDTLPTKTLLTSIINNYGSKYQKSITEPDNGHKAETTTIKLDLKQESERLKTFTNWNCEAVHAEDLAKAGFYFLNRPNNPDLVKCAFCLAEICNWENGDDAFEEHKRWSPNCPFIKDRLPNRSALGFLNSQASGQDVCGNAEILKNSIPESQTFRLLSNMVKNYDDEKVRFDSYVDWPKTSKQQPEVLAKAGFFYRGVEDHVICFACGGGLKEWKDEDEPWEQHALWFPKCRFLLNQKGGEFVEAVQRKFRNGDVPCTFATKEESHLSTCEQNQPNSPDDGILRCKICDLNERNVIFIPCKHILACDECARQLENCPVCRRRIDNRMKVFLS